MVPRYGFVVIILHMERNSYDSLNEIYPLFRKKYFQRDFDCDRTVMLIPFDGDEEKMRQFEETVYYVPRPERQWNLLRQWHNQVSNELGEI